MGECLVNYIKFVNVVGGGICNIDWWFNQLCFNIFCQYMVVFDFFYKEFNYVVVFKFFDYNVFKKDFIDFMINLQDWWFVDFGYYGGFFIRMVWYSVGIYWVFDGCGGGGQGQ